ncbi:MAG: non-ribosomal peptide synthetase [Labedaea sp.]
MTIQHTDVLAGWRPTVGQQQMLTFERLVPGSSWHNVPLYVRITGAPDLAALRAAVSAMVDRHEALRTAFHLDVDTPVAIPTQARLELSHRELTALPGAQRASALAELQDLELRTAFDLERGLLARAVLATMDEREHLLILTFHHLAVDGQSLAVLCRDLVDAYRAALAGSVAASAGPRYSAHAARHHEFVAGDEVAEQFDYWRGDLAGLPEPAVLPFARPRGSGVGSFAAERVDFTVPAGLAGAVRELAARQRATPFMVLLSAFGELLRRYTGAADLIVGTPTAGRDHPEDADLVGYLVNVVPLRLRLDRTRSWLDVLRVVRDATLDGYENSGVPLSRLAEEFDRGREAGVHPLFQIVFAAPPALGPPSTVDEVTFAFGGGTSVESLYDIEVEILDDGTALGGYLKCRTGLFDREHIDGLLDHFRYLAERMVAAPEQNPSNVAVLRPKEWQRVVVDWNDTATGYPRDATLLQLFGEWVRGTPDVPAVRYGAVELTYAELDVRANRLANHLRANGVGPQDAVGICVGFGVDWVVAALAVLKAGGGYVPLDPSYPVPRLELMCADAGIPIVLTDRSMRDHLPAIPALVLDEPADAAAIAAERATPPEVAARSESLAYVMYTSGSTGRPKGVAVTHRNIVRLVRDTDYLELRPGDRIAQAANLSFDAATFELWGALLNGATLIGVERDVLLSAPKLAEQLRADRIEVLFLTTSLARQIAVTAPQTVATLRSVLFGGEPADPHLVAGLLAAGGPQLVNGYGPTETTTFATTHTWPAGATPPPADERVPIGRPIANSTLYLLDADLQPVGPGRTGEIHLGGDGVARGYVGRPDLTAERFLPDPFGRPGSRLYRTGDLGRYRPDGTVEYLGRIDRQVKIRGFRIEPGEVESCLLETGWVREVTVQVRADDTGSAALIGYVVLADRAGSTDELRALLSDRLPAHLVPTALVAMAALPVTANGKLDVAALPDPAATGAPAEQAEPRTETERTVLDAWRDVLDRPGIGVHDDFFLLGGHSIKAGQVMTRVRAALGIPAPLRLIFDNPTVATLAAVLDERLERKQ